MMYCMTQSYHEPWDAKVCFDVFWAYHIDFDIKGKAAQLCTGLIGSISVLLHAISQLMSQCKSLEREYFYML